MSKGARGPSTRAKFSGNPSLRDALLSGMLGGPALRDELGEAAQRPAGLELADDVHEVGVGVDSGQQTVVDEREADGEALAAALGAGEEKGTARGGEEPDAPLDAPVVDLEPPVIEAAAEELALVPRVGRRAPQRRLRQELGVDLIHPRVELVQQGQRAPPALFASRLGVETALLARGLYVVELLEELERDRRPLVLGQQGRMELAADVHAATQAPLIGDDDDGLFAVVVLELDFTGVPGVPIALDETRDRSEPVGDVGGLPARGVAVGDHLGAAHDAIGPDE